MPYLMYVAVCLIIGFVGVNRKFGFWGYFFGSLLLTPGIGVLLLLASDPVRRPVAARRRPLIGRQEPPSSPGKPQA